MSSTPLTPIPPLASADPAAALRAAFGHIAAQRWDAAIGLLEPIADSSADATVTLRLARNLAALQLNQPQVYRVALAELSKPNPTPRYQPYATDDGTLGLALRQDDGRLLFMCNRPDPRQAAAEVAKQTDPAAAKRQAIGLMGLGDGYLLTHLAANPPKLFMSQTLAVYVFEPDPELLLACLKLHDWWADDGPIADPRFLWFVGAGWDARFEQAFEAEDYLPLPHALVRQGPRGQNIADRYDRAKQRISERIEAQRRRIHARYAARTDEQYRALFTGQAERRPRVMLLTSRFTTVLQHATADAAAAFAELGWDTELLIEPTDHHVVTNVTLLRTLDRFDPDLIFNIDHLRSEYRDTIPPTLPYICWAQDHLPTLTHAKAGASVNDREFVLTMLGPLYRKLWAYPATQLLPIPKLTRVPPRPATWTSDGPDLIYVSNASHPAQRLKQMTMERAGQEPHRRRVIEQAADRILAVYEQGGSLPAMGDVGRIVDRVLDEAGASSLAADKRSLLVHLLHHPLNDGLYRQQALGWVADAADDMGLDLQLFGSGWEKHERFARYAQGPVQYGPQLEALTRRAKACLQIVPSYCLHQRMLDGLAAGGFFLVRRHTSDTAFTELATLLARHADDEADTVETARASLDEAHRARFDELIDAAAALSDIGTPIDTVAWMRDAIASRMIPATGVPLPRFDQTSFADADELRRCLERFLPDEALRHEVAAAQRRRVEAELTYTAGLGRMLCMIAARFQTPARAAA